MLLTCKAAARLTLSAFGLISSIEEDMMEAMEELGDVSSKSPADLESSLDALDGRSTKLVFRFVFNT